MSELEKTAPNEIYLIVGDADKDCNFNELAEVTWADKPIYEETAIKYVKSSQLTIPKSIADMVDKQKTTKLKFDDYDNEFFPYFKWSTEFDKQHGKFSSSYLLEAYLAGKALGVDLVKVVEG